MAQTSKMKKDISSCTLKPYTIISRHFIFLPKRLIVLHPKIQRSNWAKFYINTTHNLHVNVNWSTLKCYMCNKSFTRQVSFPVDLLILQIWCDFDRASSLICGNKMPNRCTRGFSCRSYCLLNMFRAPLCPSSGAQEYYTVVAACGIILYNKSAIKTSVASSWQFFSTY